MTRARTNRGTHKLEKRDFEQIFNNLPDPIFVTDAQGNLLLSNSTTALVLDLSLDKLLQSNVRDLVKKGHYSRTNVFDAAEKKATVSGLLSTKIGITYISTSTPVLDANGDVQLVITTARPRNLIDNYTCQEEKDLANRHKREMEYLRSYVLDSENIVAESKVMRQILFEAHGLAQADSTTVIFGESGTGKELLAKYIHRHSKRANEAFIAVNSAAFPEQLVESELFGYEKGAFTGASREGKMGLLEAAHRGTLFLDEIAELPLPIQSKLLRVLETGEVRRIGSNVDIKIDFRLITATHRDLKELTEKGAFRSDLYYRLNVIPLHIPPLRERPEDIIALAKKFLGHYGQKYGVEVELDASTIESLVAYSWPGNVRELRNDIERRVIRSLQKYPAEFADTLSGQIQSLEDFFKLFGLTGSIKDVQGKVEKYYIDYVLKSCNGRVSKAAEILGIRREVLSRKLKSMRER